MRLGSAADLARRLRTLEERRAEALQRAEEVERVRRAEAAIERTRLRRPWIATATTALILALGVSLWLNHLANQQRRFAEKELRAQTAMLSFLADDLLQQSNPYARPAGSDKGGQQTLLEAIAVAAPRIEVRFAQQPEVAAQLHETIGDVLRRRTRFPEAEREYSLAAESYREVEGPLSQDAQVVELKRVGAELSGRLPGFMDRAKTNFARQQELSAKLKPPVRAKLRAWQAYTEAAFLGTGPNPESALPKLDEAARIAETDPELKRSMSTDIKLRSGGIYVFENDGVNLERVAREVIASETQLRGLQSTYILPAQMYLQEAFYSEGKYQAAIEQGKRNRQKFLEVLSSDHQLTLGTLATKAAAEAQLEQYSDAVEDDLELNRDSVGLPSGARMAAGALHDAALFECHMGRFQAGIEHARQVLAKWGSGPQAQPVFAEGSKHVIAECIIGEQESKASRPDEKRLREADGLLRSLNLPLVAQAVGNHDLEQSVDLDRGRLFLLRGEYAQSGEIVAKLAPAMHKDVVDTYDKRQFVRLNQALAAHGAAAAP